MATRTRTVVFTDLADYTAKVARSDREALRALITQHEALVGPAVRRHGGRVVKNLGDSFLCLFESATDGIRAALEIQAAVSAQGTLIVRVAMTTGDVEEIDGDAFGDAVNVAARILSKTPAGEVWFGCGTRQCMNAAEIAWDVVGRFFLKGVPGEVEVFRAVPGHRCWLPDRVIAALRGNRLVRVRRGQRPPGILPPEPIVVLEDFTPGSPDLVEAMARLPVIDPGNVFLLAWQLAPADRHAWTDHGQGLVIGTPVAYERALVESSKAASRLSGADTIVLEGGLPGLDLVLAGLALPAVPLAEVVASYFYDLLPDGRWASEADQAVLRLEVTPEGATVLVTSRGVTIDGRLRGVDERVRLRDGTRIEVGGATHLWRSLDPAQGYVGLALADGTMRLAVIDGQTAEVGREPAAPGLPFPDRRGQGNLRWCSGPRAAKARAGGFTLDRALAGRRQASITPDGDVVEIEPLHEHCATFLLRAGSRALERATGPTRAAVGDLLVAGTSVVALRDPSV